MRPVNVVSMHRAVTPESAIHVRRAGGSHEPSRVQELYCGAPTSGYVLAIKACGVLRSVRTNKPIGIQVVVQIKDRNRHACLPRKYAVDLPATEPPIFPREGKIVVVAYNRSVPNVEVRRTVVEVRILAIRYRTGVRCSN